MYSNSLPCVGTAHALTREQRQSSDWQRACVKTGKSSLTVQPQTFTATGPAFMSTLQYRVVFTVYGLDSLGWGWQAMSAVSLPKSPGLVNHKKHLGKDSFEKYPAKCIARTAPLIFKDSTVGILPISVQSRGIQGDLATKCPMCSWQKDRQNGMKCINPRLSPPDLLVVTITSQWRKIFIKGQAMSGGKGTSVLSLDFFSESKTSELKFIILFFQNGYVSLSSSVKYPDIGV